MKIAILIFGFISNDGVSTIIDAKEYPTIDDLVACVEKVDNNHFCEITNIDIKDLNSLEIVKPE